MIYIINANILMYVKNKGVNKGILLSTDTNSLMNETETENIYEDCYKDKELFNFCKYSKDSKYYDKTNNVIVGKMKNETCGVPMKSFLGLKAKIYTHITKDKHECKKAKSTNNSVAEDELKHENLKNVMFNVA